MDIRKVKKLIELLEESGISELEISEGEESVRISRYPRGAVQLSSQAPAAHLQARRSPQRRPRPRPRLPPQASTSRATTNTW